MTAQNPVDLVIRNAVKRGWTVQARTEATATVVQPKQFDALGCLLLGFLPYVLWYGLVMRDKTWYVEAQPDGSALWNGMTPEEIRERQARAKRTQAAIVVVAVLLILAMCAWICYVSGSQ